MRPLRKVRRSCAWPFCVLFGSGLLRLSITKIGTFLTLKKYSKYFFETFFSVRKVALIHYLCPTLEALDKPKMGRPPKDAERHKRSRTLSFTDAEYLKLGQLATAAKLGRSEYIVFKLSLDK